MSAQGNFYGQQRFGLDEVRQEFNRVADSIFPDSGDKEQFFTNFDRLAGILQQEREKREWQETVFEMMTNAERHKGDVGRKQTTMEEMELQARNLLGLAATYNLETELDREACDAAAIIYVSFIDGPSPDEEIDEELLASAGVDTEWLVTYFKAAYERAYNPHGDPEVSRQINEQIQTVAHLNPLGFEIALDEDIEYPNDWQVIVQPFVDGLRAKLLAAGMDLPELGPDGMYAEEREEDG